MGTLESADFYSRVRVYGFTVREQSPSVKKAQKITNEIEDFHNPTESVDAPITHK